MSKYNYPDKKKFKKLVASGAADADFNIDQNQLIGLIFFDFCKMHKCRNPDCSKSDILH